MLALFETLGLETALAAPHWPGGQAAGELCGTEASTIHRLLETGFDPHSGRLVFSHGEDDPLKADAVIVDETSMVDVPLMAALLAALRNDCRLVLVGDPDQLPSVGPGNLFGDLIRSGTVPTVRLTQIFRQAAQSAIVRNAHLVNAGEMPDLRKNDNDFFSSPAGTLRARRRPSWTCAAGACRNGWGSRRTRSRCSPHQEAGDGHLRPEPGPPGGAESALGGEGGAALRRHPLPGGDRVMQVKNNYDIPLEGGRGRGLRDGGVQRRHRPHPVHRPAGECITVDFEGRIVEYSPDMLGELEPAYAVTVHKAQGSEYRAVILAALDGAPMLLTRGVLYTAITRARSLFIVVGREAWWPAWWLTTARPAGTAACGPAWRGRQRRSPVTESASLPSTAGWRFSPREWMLISGGGTGCGRPPPGGPGCRRPGIPWPSRHGPPEPGARPWR